jgi:hypothetical protein
LDLKRLLRYFINIFNRCTSSVNSPGKKKAIKEKEKEKTKAHATAFHGALVLNDES